jgi:hypothetical protein
MEESGISVPTVQQWLDEIEKKDSSQVFGEYNAYKKALLSSHTLETLIRALLKQPTSLPGTPLFAVCASCRWLCVCVRV